MTSVLYWVLGTAVWMVVSFYVTEHYPERAWRGYLHRFIVRLGYGRGAPRGRPPLFVIFQPRFFTSYMGVYFGMCIVIVVLGALFGLELYIPAGAIALIILDLDDVLHGEDDDRWKRYFRAAKNKVKWLWTPTPAPLQGPA